MVYSTYQYTDDAGNVWALNLPVDFATALGQTAATVQPYLDVTISPRYAIYRAASGLARQAVIDTKAHFNGIVGTTLTVGGVVYTCTAAIAQSIPAIQPGLIQAIAGPPGPQGVAQLYDSVLATNVTLSVAGTTYTLLSLTLPAGNYLLLGKALCQASATAGSDLVIDMFNGAAVISFGRTNKLAALQEATISFFLKYALASAATLTLTATDLAQAGGQVIASTSCTEFSALAL